jgi:DNA replication licensing factor MCM6
MSSLVDAIIASDNLPSGTPASSDAPAPSRRNRAGSRPSAPPSESAAARSDIDAFAEDEIVGARGTVPRPRGPVGDIPKVVDEIGEHMVQQFEDFLET